MAKVFEQITANAAQDIQWDVIIAGSSFASMFFLKGLPEGLKVLVVEKGMIRDHASQLVEGEIPITDFEMVNTSGHAKVWVARYRFWRQFELLVGAGTPVSSLRFPAVRGLRCGRAMADRL